MSLKKLLISKHHINVIALLETIVRQHNSSRIQQKFGHQWSWISNYAYSPTGRILL